jgi:hypothetical protein
VLRRRHARPIPIFALGREVFLLGDEVARLGRLKQLNADCAQLNDLLVGVRAQQLLA